MSTEIDRGDQELKAFLIKAEGKLTPFDLESLSRLISEAKTLNFKLQEHQAELEIQNEELHQVQAALDTSRAHYQELYDFAPVGYLTCSEEGNVLEINLTAANLLGKNRQDIINQRFEKFIHKEYQDVWYRHFQLAKQDCQPQGCELPICQ